MKKLFTNFLGIAFSVIVLASCSQMATYDQADLVPEEIAAAKTGFNLTPYGTGGNENAMVLTGGGDYLKNCITDTSGDIFKASGSLSDTWGGPDGDKFSKTLTVDVWNTLTTIKYKFLLTGEGGNLQYYDEVSGDWIKEVALVQNVAYTVTRPLPIGWTAGNVIVEQWRQVGQGGQLGGDGSDIVENGVVSYALIGICTTTTLTSSVSEEVCEGTEVTLTAAVSSFGAFTGGTIEILNSGNTVVASQAVSAGDKDVTFSVPTGTAGSYTYTAQYVGAGSNGYNNSTSAAVSVDVIECGGCDESFEYVNNGDGTYTFTYIPSDDLSSANLVFTFAQGIAMAGLDDWTTSGQTKQKVMNLEECEEYSWTVTLKCESNPGAQNLWTDFKVNDISKKGSLANIKCD